MDRLLNTYFDSVYTHDNGTTDLSYLSPASVPCDTDHVIFTPASVLKHIHKLNSEGSAGPDGRPADFYENTAKTIA